MEYPVILDKGEMDAVTQEPSQCSMYEEKMMHTMCTQTVLEMTPIPIDSLLIPQS